MRYLKILADDLTGAADSAARCRRFGLPATIFLDIPELPLPTGALAFTSDSRHLTAEAAGQRVHNMGASLPDVEGRWYKKIDSTLRGNIGSELDALLDLVDAPAAVVCPSFPGQGRVLRNGILTAPELGPPAVHLPSLLRKQSRHPVAALSLEQVRGGELAAKMRHLMQGRDSFTGKERTVIAVDALTDDDLDRVVGAQQEGLPAALLCGSAGLVGALARRVGIEKGSSDVCASPRAGLGVGGQDSGVSNCRSRPCSLAPRPCRWRRLSAKSLPLSSLKSLRNKKCRRRKNLSRRQASIGRVVGPPGADSYVTARPCCILVGERGFEPPTSSSRTKRATELRYSPKVYKSITHIEIKEQIGLKAVVRGPAQAICILADKRPGSLATCAKMQTQRSFAGPRFSQNDSNSSDGKLTHLVGASFCSQRA